MGDIQGQLEGLPGYDIVMDFWNDYAQEHIKVGKNPYTDENDKKLKLKSPYNTSHEHKLWKKVQKKAWVHDKCFLGSCWVGMDCGLGLVPVVVALIPAVGPLIMYGLHARLIHIVSNEYELPTKLIAQMESQILIDLLISLPPVIGGLFAWLNGCLTRNAGMIYNYFAYAAEQREKNKQPTYVGTGDVNSVPQARQPAYVGTKRQHNYQSDNTKGVNKPIFKKKTTTSNQQNAIKVGTHQQSGFV